MKELGLQYRYTPVLAFGTVVSTLLFFACESTPVAPTGPGELEAALISPHGDEGSVVLELTGAGIGQVTAIQGQAYTLPTGSGIRVVVILNNPGEIKLSIAVDDVASVPAASVIEVADGANVLRPSTTGYSVEFSIR
jgi:hypothetical protein